jgi:integrase
MNIQERKNNDGKITSYRVRVFDHRDVTTGKQIFKNLSVKYDDSKSELWNRKNAEKQGAIFERDIEELTATSSLVTFNDYSEYALKIKAQAGVSSGTIRNYNCYKRRVTPFVGHIRLKDLSPNMLNRAYSEMIEAGVSKKHVHELHRFIHNILELALKESIIPRNYAKAATPPKKERVRMNAIPEEHLNVFFKALYADEKLYEYQVLFSLLLASGCRIGELCALSFDDVNFKDGSVKVCRHWIHDESGRHVKDGCKTTAGERLLCFDKNIMTMLLEYRSHQMKKAQTLGSKWDYSTGAIFTSLKKPGNFLNPNTLRNWLKRFLQKHGLPEMSPHKFRHTAISLQLQAGISVPDVAKRAGHSRPDVTLSFYAHTMKNNDKHCCEAVTKVMPQFAKAPNIARVKKLSIC